MDRIRFVRYTVDHRIGYGAVAQLGVPRRRRELEAQYEGSRAAPRLDGLHDLARLAGLDLLEQPVVDCQQVAFDAPLALPEPALVLGDGGLVEQLGQPRAADRKERVARRETERVRDSGLSCAARAGHQDVPAVAHPAAVRQLQDE